MLERFTLEALPLEAFKVAATAFAGAATDTSATSDAATASISITAATSESAASSDSASAAISIAASLAETTASSDAESNLASLAATIGEAAATSDAPAASASGATNIDAALSEGVAADDSATASITAPQTNSGGDGDYVRRRPNLQIVVKVKEELEDVLEVLEDIDPDDRVSVNKAKIKSAIKAVRKIESAPSLKPLIEHVEQGLAKATRSAAKHQGFFVSLKNITSEIKFITAAISQKLERRRRDEEALLWLLS